MEEISVILTKFITKPVTLLMNSKSVNTREMDEQSSIPDEPP